MSTFREQLADSTPCSGTEVEAILENRSIPSVLQDLNLILNSEEITEILHALIFLRDAALYSHRLHEPFRKHLLASPIPETLRNLLQSPSRAVRRNSIYTIGKLTFREHASFLSDAFPFYLDHYPLEMPGLLSELAWLTGELNWEFVQQVASSENRCVRWSLCSALHSLGEREDRQVRSLHVLTSLTRDPYPFISAEARWLCERIKVKLGPKLPKPEWRREVKRISSLEPKVTFKRAVSQFLASNTHPDYSMRDLNQFLSELEFL